MQVAPSRGCGGERPLPLGGWALLVSLGWGPLAPAKPRSHGSLPAAVRTHTERRTQPPEGCTPTWNVDSESDQMVKTDHGQKCPTSLCFLISRRRLVRAPPSHGRLGALEQSVAGAQGCLVHPGKCWELTAWWLSPPTPPPSPPPLPFLSTGSSHDHSFLVLFQQALGEAMTWLLSKRDEAPS